MYQDDVQDNLDKPRVHDLIQTRALQIVDDEERVRMELYTDNNSQTTLQVFDLNGDRKISLGVYSDGSSKISFLDDGVLKLYLVYAQGQVFIGGLTGLTKEEPMGFELQSKPKPEGALLAFYNGSEEPQALIGTGNQEGFVQVRRGEKLLLDK